MLMEKSESQRTSQAKHEEPVATVPTQEVEVPALPAATATIEQPPPAIEVDPPADPLPETWYTARRISVMTETGVTSVPAGVEVMKVNETEILHQGKRFTVKPGDLTTDATVAGDIQSKRDEAASRLQAEREAHAAMQQQANIAAAQSQDAAKKAARQVQIAAAVASIDRQIAALHEKINNERSAEAIASIKNRISGRGAVITKCEQAIAKLEAERLRLLSASE